MSTTDRAAFEQYAESQGCRDFEYDQDDSQRYRNPFTQREYKYWRAALDWQAASEAARATGTAGERPALTGNDVIEMIVGRLVSVVGGRNLMKGEEIGFSLDDLVFVANAAAARQPAPVAEQLKLICADFGWRTDGDSNVLADRIEHHIRDLKAGIKARDTVIAERDAALAATAAPVLSDEQISKMARYLSDFSSAQCGVDKDDAWAIYGNDEIELVRAAFAATRSQP